MTDTVNNTSEASPQAHTSFNNAVGDTPKTKHELLDLPASSSGAGDAQVAEANEILEKALGKSKRIALNAQHNRVSRRLMLAMRAQKLTIVCQETGIVSLLEVPAIPNFACEFLHPLAILSNARGLAQRGKDYLRLLDSQTLAGILLTLQSPYELFRFRPFDSGAEKNAILRTAGKDLLIDTVIMVEHFVHNRNEQFLPKLSFVIDYHNDNIGVDIKLTGYLKLLAESIVKPDRSAYNENAAPKKIGRPVYIKDVERAEKKMSFLARQEIAAAKKEFEADKKAAKKFITDLYTAGKVDAKGRSVLLQIFGDDALVAIEPEQRALLAMKLATKEHAAADSLIAIIKKDRKALTMEVSELEDFLSDKQDEEVEEQILGTEETVTEKSTRETIEDWNSPEMLSQEQYDVAPSQGIDDETMGQEASEQLMEQSLVAPAGLTGFALTLWKKKHIQAARNIVQSDLPSVITYEPTAEKQNLGKDSK